VEKGGIYTHRDTLDKEKVKVKENLNAYPAITTLPAQTLPAQITRGLLCECSE